MRINKLLSGLLPVVLLFLWGCASTETPRTWVDLEAVNKSISKGEEKTPSLEEDITEGAKGEEAKQPRSTDLSVQGQGANPFLKDYLTGKKEAAVPEVDGILLNFDNADIYEVIQVIAETLNLNYIIDPQVKGIVNIRSGRKIPKEQLFAVFKKILNINGLDIRNEGDYYSIYPAKAPSPTAVNGPGQLKSLTESPSMIIQVIPVMNLASSEAIKLIEPYLSDQGAAYNLETQNTLIVQDFESKVMDAVTILARLDISPMSALKVRLIKVEKAPLFDVADELTQILLSMGVNKKDFESVSVIPLERVNSLLLVSKNEFTLNSVDKWIKELDVVPTQGRDTLNIYNVRNSVASDLAELVTTLITSEGESSKKAKTTEKKLPIGSQPQAQPTAAKSEISKKLGTPLASLRFAGEPALFADDTRNIILIRALPPDYSRIVKILERLDNLPRQVLIEVLVAEVQLTGDLQYGVEWFFRNHQLSINGTSYVQEFKNNLNLSTTESLIGDTTGFAYTIFNSANEAVANLNLLANESNVSVLSSPQVLVLNNEEATVNVGSQVPIVTSETNQTGVNTPTVDRTVQYRDTGTILTVTPRINYNGIIILDVSQEVSSVGDIIKDGVQSPTINTRQVKTKLAVKDGQTILFGGLIDKNDNTKEIGIPLLKDIPGLGWLFKSYTQSTTRTELLVMITPYVIETEDVLDQYIKKFQEKVHSLRKSISEKPKTGKSDTLDKNDNS